MSDETSTTGVETTETQETTATEETQTTETQETTATEETQTTETQETTATTDPEPSNVVPETYADFSLPEGIQLDEALLGEATPMFKDLGLTQDQAQKLVDFQAKQVQAGKQKQLDAFTDQITKWRDDSKNDKEFGGDKFEESVKIAQSAVNAFGTPELKQLLDDYGVGNHPEFIRFMWKVGQTVREDVPGGQSNASGSPQDRVNRLYPNDRNG